MAIMELYKVINRKSLEVIKGFPNKREAKAHRNSLIPQEDLVEAKKHPERTWEFDFIVTEGKDHWKKAKVNK